MNADCTAFERWLDDGLPGSGAAPARAHASTCARCASLLELEETLATPLRTQAPADFSDKVMGRIHAAPRRAVRLVPSAFPTPMWVRAFMDPLVALVVTAIVLTWFGRGALLDIGASVAARWASAQWPAFTWPAVQIPGAAAVGSLSQWLASMSARPTLLAGILVAIAPAVLLGSWQLFRWTDRLASGPSLASMLRHPGARAVAR